MRGYGEYMGDKKRIDRIETKDLEARGMEVAAFAGSTIRILTIYAIYAIVVSTSNGQLRWGFKLLLRTRSLIGYYNSGLNLIGS